MSGPLRHERLSAIKLALLAQQAHSDERSAFMRAEPIAIVGMSCRFPGAASPDAYWRLLADGVDAISEVPADRWDSTAFYAPDISVPGRMNTRWGGFIADIDRFDATFFGISPREASRMDPQQRLMLEVAWDALENAGQTRERLAGSQTGVFAACCQNDYGHLQFSDLAIIDAHTSSGTAHSIVANRLSFLLNLRGPSMTIDTACSSSLVAVHMACQSLRDRECDVAVAGAVNAILSPEMTVSLSKFGFLAPDGRCKTFDASANGFVRSEGCGVLVLKRLGHALADGDRVLAVIRGSAVNQDGRTNALTAPNGLAQQAVVRQALENAMVRPSEIGYLEAHGTGTKLGDPIEVEALAEVFGPRAAAGHPILLGSAKTNVGHLEAAAGLAGLIKVVLAMQHGAIPPHLHFRTINPHIALDDTPFVIPTALTPWPAVERRYAGVSSFGFGGTNAHVILEEAPRLPEGDASAGRDDDRSQVLTLSAPTASGLGAVARAHIDWLPRVIEGGARLADVCYSSSMRRTHHAHRLAVVGRCTSDLVDALSRAVADAPGSFEPRAQAHRPSVAFVFSGQGAQWPRMAQELLRDEPVFRKTLERCDKLIQAAAGWSVLAELAGDGSTARFAQTAIAQPALFAVEVALATLWRSWGIEPAAVAGHSVGEIAAACIADALSMEDAVRLVVLRGRLMQRATGRGRMASVELSRDDAERALDGHAGRVEIAALNGPCSTVLSGDTAAVQGLVSTLAERGVACRMLPVDYAFHSHHMDGIDEELASAMGELRPRASAIPIVSTVSGELATAHDFDTAYWRKNVRAPVLFSAAIQTLAARGCRVFVEVGPHPVLLESIRRALSEAADVLAVPSMRRGQPERAVMLASVGALYRRGADVDWAAVHPGPRRHVPPPPYPWQRERYWLEPRKASPVLPNTAPESDHPLVGTQVTSPLVDGLVLQSTLGADLPDFVRDHRILGSVVLPATAYLEMAISGATRMLGGEAEAIQDLLIREPMPLGEGERRLVQTIIERLDTDRAAVRIFSVDPALARDRSAWRLHVTATVLRRAAAEDIEKFTDKRWAERRARVDSAAIPGRDFYAQLDAVGAQFGPAFRGIVRLWLTPGQAVAEIEVPDAIAAQLGTYRAHPALMDACLQSLVAAGASTTVDLRIPLAVACWALYRPLAPRLWAHATIGDTDGTGDVVTGNVQIHDDDGQLAASVEGITFTRVAADPRRRSGTAPALVADPTFTLAWRREPLGSVVAPAAAWLIVAERGGLGERLARALAGRGQACVLARPGDGFALRGPAEYAIDAESPEDVERVLHAAFDGSAPRRGVVVLAGLDAPDPGEPGSAVAALAPSSRRALAISSAVVRFVGGVSTLCFVTRGAVAVGAALGPVSVSQAPLCGLARVVAVEQPELRCVTFDLDPAGSSATDEVDRLVDDLLGGDAEDRIALRAGQRYVARLTAGIRAGEASARHLADHGPVTLRVPTDGVIDHLTLEPVERRPPAQGEVEIRVLATGLNFRDVLNTLGMYPGEAGPLGSECAGIVTAIGDGVTRVGVGDSVVAIALASFSTYVTARAELVVSKPVTLGFDQAAAVPIAFLTAQYALEHAGRMRPGHRVLIHAAAGGVGLAAVHLALRAGAEVFATAGSPEKRAILADLGVPHVMDSRSLMFADQIRARTDGRGVDIVLNSLTGPFIPATLSAVAPGGSFLEIGRREILDPADVRRHRADVDYRVIYLAEVWERDPELIRSMLDSLLVAVATGDLPALPCRVFPLAEAASAFRFMAQARHVGKIVLSQVEATPAGAVRDDATYLVTGGLGGLGLAVAQWLVDRGARHLALVGRSAPSERAQVRIREIEGAGAQVDVFAADVARPGDVGAVLAHIERERPPLRGIVHAAGVVDDAALLQQDWSRFERVMAPKVEGAWNLHALARTRPLDFFVMFSSVASLLGSGGQANYAAANAFLDALAHRRRAEGRAGLSVNWGPWDSVGMAARLGDADRLRLARSGLSPMPADRALDALGRALAANVAQAAIVEIDWHVHAQERPRALASELVSTRPNKDATPPARAGRGDDFVEMLDGVPETQRRRLIAAHVRRLTLGVLGLPASHPLDPQQGLRDAGLDSLMAVELRNALQGRLRRPLPASLAFDHPTLDALGTYVERELFPAKTGPESEPAQEARDVAELETLTDEEAETVLSRELESRGAAR